jgi:ribosomal protein S18 acetylase RimI-like enzyme
VTVRRAAAPDAAGIAAVHVDSWRRAYRGLLTDAVLDGLDVGRRTAGWTRLLEDPDPRSAVFLTENPAGTVTGFVHIVPTRDGDGDDRTGEITSIYVSPASWGTGAGRALMAAAVGAAHADGFDALTLWVLRDNARARRFYEAAGWAADGLTKDDVLAGTPIVEVRYRRAL